LFIINFAGTTGVTEVAKQQSVSANGTAMTTPTSPVTTALLKFAQATFLDLPAATVKRMVSSDGERAMYEAGWKAYDALVGVSNELTNQLYSSEAFGTAAGRMIDATVRWQRFQNALAGAFFSSLWPAIGLPTASELESMREEVRAMREELAAQRAEQATARAAESPRPSRERISSPVMTPSANPAVHQIAVWSGWPISEAREVDDVGN
jgi:hypothetical protein